jgi:hypothetical protein
MWRSLWHYWLNTTSSAAMPKIDLPYASLRILSKGMAPVHRRAVAKRQAPQSHQVAITARKAAVRQLHRHQLKGSAAVFNEQMRTMPSDDQVMSCRVPCGRDILQRWCADGDVQ